MSETDKLIARINELSQLSRERELTPDEVEERTSLRAKYLLNFRKNFRDQLDNTFVQDDEGNKVPLKDWHQAVEGDAEEAFTEEET